MADEPLFVTRSKTGRAIRLTSTIWRKIQSDHPEFSERPDYVAEIRLTISDPDYVVVGWDGADLALRWCDGAPGRPKFLSVVYRELDGDGFVITAFFVSRHERLLRRGITWQRT